MVGIETRKMMGSAKKAPWKSNLGDFSVLLGEISPSSSSEC